MRRTDFVELPAQRVLYREVFEHGLDDDVARGQRRDLGRAGEIREDAGDLVRSQFPALDRFREEAFGLLARALESIRALVEHDGPKARARRDDGNAGAHGAAAGDAYGFDFS